MSDAGVSAVERLRVDAVQVTHAPAEVRPGRLEHEVVVVFHEAVGQADPGEAGDGSAECCEEHFPIAIVDEDRLVGVAAGGYVVKRAREFDPEWSRHSDTVFGGSSRDGRPPRVGTDSSHMTKCKT